MKSIAVVTATRAEYGLLSPIVRQLRTYENKELSIELIVTGAHLVSKYGYTIQEIEADQIRIDEIVDIPVDSDSETSISNNQAVTLIKFTELFARKHYDALILLGDRYEMLAIAIAAGNTHIPIFHISGGDTTEGAIDEWIRHSITKMSYLHFTTNEDSRKRVIQMGEDPNRVFNYGSTSIDNIMNLSTMELTDVLESINLLPCKYAVCTYHPVTMETEDVETQIYYFLEAIKRFPQIDFIVTKSNADQGGDKINEILECEEKNIKNMHVYTSLGVKRYLSLMKHAEFVLGNSSSGIIETPAFHIPTVNIGDRQKGRLQSKSTINCLPDTESIIEAISYAMSEQIRTQCKQVISPYGDGTAALKVAKKSIEVVLNDSIDLKKKFYDSEVLK